MIKSCYSEYVTVIVVTTLTQNKVMADTKNKKYVVVRSGLRVSDMEYDNYSDANAEVEHWKSILKRWPDGTVVEVVEKDEKKHRVW